MKHLTLNEVLKISRNVSPELFIENLRSRPQPYPGKSWPTRVAWEISVIPLYSENPVEKKLRYVGKPSRYRAIQAMRFLQQPNVRIMGMWQMELDKSGPIAWSTQSYLSKPMTLATHAYTAYHPHMNSANIIENFTKLIYPKRIGGFTVYSNQRKLAVEKVDAFYAWYAATFGKKLRRPKQTAMIQVGEPIEATEL